MSSSIVSSVTAIRMEMLDEGDSAEIYVYDDIGTERFFFEEFGAKDMRDAIMRAGDAKKLIVRINSVGGNAYEAIAMYSLLVNSGKEVETQIDGLAASSASIVAMGGKCRMNTGSQMMIHEPEVVVSGNVAQLEKGIAQLKAGIESAVSIYAKKSGKSEQSIRIMMEKETWLTPEQAKSEGFADSISSDDAIPLKVTPAMAMSAKGKMKIAPNISLFDTAEEPKGEIEMSVEEPKTKTEEVAKISMTVEEYEALKAKQVPKTEAPKVIEPKAENVEMTAKEQRAKAIQYAKNVNEICMTAGIDADAKNKFLDEETPIEIVQQAAIAKMSASNQRPAEGNGDSPSDDNTEFRKEYRDAKASGIKMTVSEEEYIKSRRITAGKDSLLSIS